MEQSRARLKPGMEKQLLEQFRIFEAAKVPGVVATHCYRMDPDPNEYYMAVVRYYSPVLQERGAYL